MNLDIECLGAVSCGEQHGTTRGYECNTETHIVLMKYTAHQDKATGTCTHGDSGIPTRRRTFML